VWGGGKKKKKNRKKKIQSGGCLAAKKKKKYRVKKEVNHRTHLEPETSTFWGKKKAKGKRRGGETGRKPQPKKSPWAANQSKNTPHQRGRVRT